MNLIKLTFNDDDLMLLMASLSFCSSKLEYLLFGEGRNPSIKEGVGERKKSMEEISKEWEKRINNDSGLVSGTLERHNVIATTLKFLKDSVENFFENGMSEANIVSRSEIFKLLNSKNKLEI
jgi:hypothetical protein